MIFYCDDSRHLVCIPYNIENLHKMAAILDIKRCWFHSSGNKYHYDIPKRRIKEIKKKCVLVYSKDIIKIIRGIE